MHNYSRRQATSNKRPFTLRDCAFLTIGLALGLGLISASVCITAIFYNDVSVIAVSLATVLFSLVCTAIAFRFTRHSDKPTRTPSGRYASTKPRGERLASFVVGSALLLTGVAIAFPAVARGHAGHHNVAPHAAPHTNATHSTAHIPVTHHSGAATNPSASRR